MTRQAQHPGFSDPAKLSKESKTIITQNFRMKA